MSKWTNSQQVLVRTCSQISGNWVLDGLVLLPWEWFPYHRSEVVIECAVLTCCPLYHGGPHQMPVLGS